MPETMGGPQYNFCQDIGGFISYALGNTWGDALGSAAGTFCVIARTGENNGAWTESRKQCNGYTTPLLKWLPIKFTTKDLNDLPYSELWEKVGSGENPYYVLDCWVGIEEKSSGSICAWFGIEADPGFNPGPDVALCAQAPCTGEALPYEAVHTMVEDVLDEIGGAVDDGSAIDLIIETAKAIMILVIVAGILYALSSIASATVAGAALLGLGGALVGSVT